MVFRFILAIDSWDISHEISSRWMSSDVTDDKSTFVQVMAWCRQAPRSLLPYGITRPQQLNSSWFIDTIWGQKPGPSLNHVMACYLMAPSHYLNVDLSSKVFSGIHLRAILQGVLTNFIQNMCLKIRLSKLLPHLPGANELIRSL